MKTTKLWILGWLVIFLALAVEVSSIPDGPNVVTIRNETKTLDSSALINTSGGIITTMVLNSSQQNLRWKAFVGNVSGTLTLDDASGYSVFDWGLTDVVGEVYATRSSNTIDWSNINCSTTTNITNEEVAINHINNPSDNITATFSEQNHNPFYVGNVYISQDSCYSLHTYQNGTSQTSNFEEILLHDKDNVVYATLIEDNLLGYNPNQTLDFQMIVPENGLDSWGSSTAYYFYVELI